MSIAKRRLKMNEITAYEFQDICSIEEVNFDLTDQALEMAAGNSLEVGPCITSTDRTICGCR